jgi:SAM-dependent methyltransferase
MKKIEPYKGIADIYEEIRPSYPENLIQDIISKTHIKANDLLLEIGAGTGKATLQFAEKGFRIHAIEIGADMAKILKDKCSEFRNVSLDIISFEEWNSPSGYKYDVIYSAQAFHWINKEIKYQKCYELLKENGFLVLFWYKPSNDKLPLTKEIDEKVNGIVRKYISNITKDNGKAERLAHNDVSNIDERKTEIEASGLFHLVDKLEYTQEIKDTPSQYLKAMKSIPAYASILDGLGDKTIEKMDNEIVEVINNHGGYVNELFEFSLYISQKMELSVALNKD